jgi:hypothetical protein
MGKVRDLIAVAEDKGARADFDQSGVCAPGLHRELRSLAIACEEPLGLPLRSQLSLRG